MSAAAWVWLIVIAVLLAAEFILLALGLPLLSHAVWEFMDEQEGWGRLLILAVGILLGHFFWPRRIK